MLDSPFRVELDARTTHNGGSYVVYTIVRAGDGQLASTRDVNFAYHLVDLLNADDQKSGGSRGP